MAQAIRRHQYDLEAVIVLASPLQSKNTKEHLMDDKEPMR
jgi:hypothetical protein